MVKVEHVQKDFGTQLQEYNFNFLLNAFSDILPKSAVLFKILQTKLFDINYCLRKIEDFRREVRELRTKFDEFWDKTEAEDRSDPLRKKKRIVGDRKSSYRALFCEIIDTVSQQINNRYAELGKLEFLSLLNYERYAHYSTDRKSVV